MTLRQDKVGELIQQSAAEFLSRETDKSSLVTVTKANVSKDMAQATIYISVFPVKKEEEALHFCRRHAGDFRTFMKSKFESKRLPYFSFEIDVGEKNRQKIDELS